MVARKIPNYRLNMAGITQNKEKWITLDQNEEKINIKKQIIK